MTLSHLNSPHPNPAVATLITLTHVTQTDHQLHLSLIPG